MCNCVGSEGFACLVTLQYHDYSGTDKNGEQGGIKGWVIMDWVEPIKTAAARIYCRGMGEGLRRVNGVQRKRRWETEHKIY